MPPTHLRITAKRPGFFRAGIAHPGHPVDHPITDFTDKEIAALKEEAMLVVHEVELRAPEPEPGTKK